MLNGCAVWFNKFFSPNKNIKEKTLNIAGGYFVCSIEVYNPGGAFTSVCVNNIKEKTIYVHDDLCVVS